VTKKPHRQDAEGAEEKKSFTAKDAKVAKGIIIKIKSRPKVARKLRQGGIQAALLDVSMQPGPGVLIIDSLVSFVSFAVRLFRSLASFVSLAVRLFHLPS